MKPESQQDRQNKKMGRPRKYDEAFRQAALERMKTSQDVIALARELGVNRSQLYRWRNEALGHTPTPRPDSWLQEKSEEGERRRIAELERLVARQALELDFFKGALLRIEENRRKRGRTSGKPSRLKPNNAVTSRKVAVVIPSSLRHIDRAAPLRTGVLGAGDRWEGGCACPGVECRTG